MKYFKYIIILILFLICALLYMQLNDYDNISNSLLHDNIETKEQMEKLSNSVNDIKEHSLELQQKINILYSIIDAKEIEIEMLEDSCIQTDQPLNTQNQTDEITPETHEGQITLKNENKVTGFE